MKVFGFSLKSERRFVNITCNLILSVMVVVVFGLSVFAPISVETGAFNSNGAIYCGDKASNKVCLMVNVYWGTEFLEDMLDVFEQNQVKTTFFVGGVWCCKNVEVLRRIASGGHEVANHGYNHLDAVKINAEKLGREINLTSDLVLSYTGVKTKLFAPPSGSVNKNVVDEALKQNHKTIMWTHDTIDWRDHDEEKIFSRATKSTVGGDLILMHPTKETASVLGRIIQALKDKGLNLTTVSEVVGV